MRHPQVSRPSRVLPTGAATVGSARAYRQIHHRRRPSVRRLTGELDDFGQPDEDAVIVALAGDPLYVGVKLLDQEHRLADVRLLAPVLPRSKVVGIGRNYAAHAAELGNDVPDEPLIFLKPNTSAWSVPATRSSTPRRPRTCTTRASSPS